MPTHAMRLHEWGTQALSRVSWIIMGKPIAEEQYFSLEATIEHIDALEKTINDLCIYTRRYDFYPFDTVAGEMLAKAFALSRSAVLLVQNGYPDEAFGLCRSLYESAIYLRFITQDPDRRDERSAAFLEFGVTSKAFWFDLLDKSATLTEEEREDIQRYKAENKIPDDPKRVTRPWSGNWKLIEKVAKEPHPTDSEASTEEFRLKEKAIAYTDTSSYVHCTQPGLNSYTYQWTEPIIVRNSRSLETNTAQKTCMLIQVHLREIVRYCLLGLGVVSLDDLKSREHAAADIFSDPSAAG
jgi:Family of unknown function (DUF5677)